MSIARRPARVLALATASLLVLGACGTSPEDGAGERPGTADPETTTQPSGEPVSGGTLRYLHNIEPPTWDTSRQPGLALNSIHSSLFATLFHQKEDGTYEGWLAEDWERSEDELTYTLFLRDDVTFHDGEQFNAEAVVKAFDRVLDPDSGLNAPIRPEEYEATDEFTFTFTLPRRDAVTLHALSTPHFSIISPAILDNHTSAEIGEDPTLLVGTGPFKVASYTRGSQLIIERFEEYNWAPEGHGRNGPAYLDAVEISFVVEPFTRVNSLESGQVDAIDAVPPLDADSLVDGGFTILEADNSGFPYSISLNVGLEPLDDLKVREAFRAAINIEGLLQGLYAGWYDKAWTNVTPVTPPLGSYLEEIEGTWGYDLDLAEQLLDEAGWDQTDGDGVRIKDGERLTLYWKDDAQFLQQDQRLQLGEGVIASLEEAGFEIVRTQYDSSAYRDELAKGRHHLAPSSRGFADVRTGVGPLASENNPATPGSYINYGLLEDADIDAWYADLGQESDPEVRIELSHQIQQRATEQVYIVPLYVPKKLVGTAANVHGWHFDAVGYTDTYYNVWIDTE